jgi:methionyl-tRNA synthetase
MEGLILSPKILLLILTWTLPWKGVALWRAAKNSHQKWFIAILILNTLAILEIVYLFYFNRKTPLSSEGKINP